LGTRLNNAVLSSIRTTDFGRKVRALEEALERGQHREIPEISAVALTAVHVTLLVATGTLRCTIQPLSSAQFAVSEMDTIIQHTVVDTYAHLLNWRSVQHGSHFGLRGCSVVSV
jgi:hypothetical protein